ncbi:MAG: tripartite tricarboxylate transporter TctB family protein [Bacteroidetes bacterium]|nr:tripartite tricarboxylate transporter TctB family protein [Bacteroidota bacterium]
MKKKDLVAGIVFLSFAIILYANASTYPVKEGGSVVLSPGFYPKLLAVLMGGLSVLSLFTTLKKWNSEEDCPAKEKRPLFKTRGGKLFLLTIFLLILYPFTLEFLGFATSAFLFIFVLIAALTEDFKSHIFATTGISILITLVMYLVFKVVLQIPFPHGLLI